MRALTLRLHDSKHQRLKLLAKSKGMSINSLLDEITTLILVIHQCYIDWLLFLSPLQRERVG